jgi:GNAT superfamily N-acetyltransferase
MGGKGDMRGLLARERRHAKPPYCKLLPSNHTPARAITLRESLNGIVLGWALLIYISGEPFIHIYVHKEQRRKGIGRRLIKHAKRFAANPEYLASGRSQKFFTAVGLES